MSQHKRLSEKLSPAGIRKADLQQGNGSRKRMAKENGHNFIIR
jgi:hypothetical protein